PLADLADRPLLGALEIINISGLGGVGQTELDEIIADRFRADEQVASFGEMHREASNESRLTIIYEISERHTEARCAMRAPSWGGLWGARRTLDWRRRGLGTGP